MAYGVPERVPTLGRATCILLTVDNRCIFDQFMESMLIAISKRSEDDEGWQLPSNAWVSFSSISLISLFLLHLFSFLFPLPKLCAHAPPPTSVISLLQQCFVVFRWPPFDSPFRGSLVRFVAQPGAANATSTSGCEYIWRERNRINGVLF
jgi:hypothetical protein